MCRSFNFFNTIFFVFHMPVLLFNSNCTFQFNFIVTAVFACLSGARSDCHWLHCHKSASLSKESDIYYVYMDKVAVIKSCDKSCLIETDKTCMSIFAILRLGKIKIWQIRTCLYSIIWTLHDECSCKWTFTLLWFRWSVLGEDMRRVQKFMTFIY